MCLKHRKIRREIPAGAYPQCHQARTDGSGVCSLTPAAMPGLSCRAVRAAPSSIGCAGSLDQKRSGFAQTSPLPIYGHRSRAGCLSANQTMPVQIRLTVPFFKKPSTHGGRQRAAESPKLSHSGQHRIAVPINMWPISQRLEAGASKASISRCKSCIGLPTINHGELAHSVEHRSCKPEAAGAKPAFSTIYQTGRLGSSEPRCL